MTNIISLNSNYFEFFTAAAVSLNPKQIKFRQILLLYKAHKNSQYRIVYYPGLKLSSFPFSGTRSPTTSFSPGKQF